MRRAPWLSWTHRLRSGIRLRSKESREPRACADDQRSWPCLGERRVPEPRTIFLGCAGGVVQVIRLPQMFGYGHPHRVGDARAMSRAAQIVGEFQLCAALPCAAIADVERMPARVTMAVCRHVEVRAGQVLTDTSRQPGIEAAQEYFCMPPAAVDADHHLVTGGQ